MNRCWPVVISLLAMTLISGCWDRTFLKDVRLILGVGIDKGENEGVLSTFILPDVTDKKRNAPEILSAEGGSVRESRFNLGKQLTLVPDASKNRFTVIGEQLAKQDLYEVLDVLYRDPKSALNAKIAVVDGRAKEFLHTGYTKKSNFILNLDKQIASAEKETIVPKINIQSILSIMLDPGQDIVVPLLGVGNDIPLVKGLALFNKKSFTGELNSSESTICLLMADRMGKGARITLPILNGKKIGGDITFQVFHLNRKMNVDVRSDNVAVKIDLTIKVVVDEFPISHLDEVEQVGELNELISDQMTERAQLVVQKLQKANCDVFGIGRRLIAFHPKYWSRIDWYRTYPQITIQPNLKVEIARPGIIF